MVKTENITKIYLCLGTSLTYVVEPVSLNVTLSCWPCNEGYFETEYTRSSDTSHIKDCQYIHMTAENISPHLVLHRQGTKSSATEWHCDSENGYYEKDGNKLCDDVPTHKCDCVRKTCNAGQLLRPGTVKHTLMRLGTLARDATVKSVLVSIVNRE